MSAMPFAPFVPLSSRSAWQLLGAQRLLAGAEEAQSTTLALALVRPHWMHAMLSAGIRSPIASVMHWPAFQNASSIDSQMSNWRSTGTLASIQEISMSSAVKRLTVFALALLVGACSTTVLHSPELTDHQVSKVSAGGPWLNPTRWGPSGVDLMTIDDKPVNNSAKVLPGQHVIVVEVDRGKTALNSRNIKSVNLITKAGHSYTIRAQLTNRPLLGYGGTTWVWAEDDQSNEAIAGMRPPN